VLRIFLVAALPLSTSPTEVHRSAPADPADPADRTAAAMAGLLRFKKGRVDAKTMELLEGKAHRHDWVALQYAAAGHGMLARKLASVSAGREAAALERAVNLYSRADAARRERSRWPTP